MPVWQTSKLSRFAYSATTSFDANELIAGWMSEPGKRRRDRTLIFFIPWKSHIMGLSSSKPDHGCSQNVPASLFLNIRQILYQNAWNTMLKTRWMVLAFPHLNPCWLVDQKLKWRISLILDNSLLIGLWKTMDIFHVAQENNVFWNTLMWP